MNPTENLPKIIVTNNEVEKKDRNDSSSTSQNNSNVSNIGQEILSKYPLNSTIKKLDSTLEIKQAWLYSEWATVCQFSKYICPHFPNRNDLDPNNKNPNVKLIESTFNEVRGKWALWQAPREEARWKKVETTALKIEWVVQNVEVLYPSKEQFKVSELNGIVLWDDGKVNTKRYQLYEGNHRISAWLASKTPQTLPAILYIGKPAKSLTKI
jgi:hypothetical protein